jgi:hypothetical protein
MKHNEAERVVFDLLASVGRVQHQVKLGNSRVDLVLTSHDGTKQLFEVKAYASVRPSDRRLLESPRPKGVTRVVVAPRISDVAAQELEAAGLSWAALDGPAYIAAPGVMIRVLRRQPEASKPAGAGPEFTWTTVSRDVGEYVLTRAHPWSAGTSIPLPRTEDIAEVVAHSQTAVAKTMRGLATRGWLLKEGPQRGRGSRWELLDPTGLLDDWTAEYPRPTEVLAHGLIGDYHDFARTKISEVIPVGEWCLAGTSASQLIAPVLTATPILECAISYEVTRNIATILENLGLRRVERGHRIRFVTVPAVTLATASDVTGLPVTSPVRTYGDVHALAGRGPEIAANLRQVALGY